MRNPLYINPWNSQDEIVITLPSSSSVPTTPPAKNSPKVLTTFVHHGFPTHTPCVSTSPDSLRAVVPHLHFHHWHQQVGFPSWPRAVVGLNAPGTVFETSSSRGKGEGRVLYMGEMARGDGDGSGEEGEGFDRVDHSCLGSLSKEVDGEWYEDVLQGPLEEHKTITKDVAIHGWIPKVPWLPMVKKGLSALRKFPGWGSAVVRSVKENRGGFG